MSKNHRGVLRAIAAIVFMVAIFGIGHVTLQMAFSGKTALPALIDTSEATHSIWNTEPKYFFWNVDTYANADVIRRKLIVIGASNARIGFQRAYLQPLLPDIEIHNAALAASEISQIYETVRLILRYMPQDQAENTVFLLGISLANFRRMKGCCVAPGVYDLQNEMNRFKVYYRDGEAVIPTFPDPFLQPWKDFVRPYAALATWLKKENRARRIPTIEELRARAEKMRHVGIEDYRARLGTGDGTFPEERLPLLMELAKLIRDAGAKLVVAQLPHVRSNRLEMPEYEDFLTKIAPYSERLSALDGVTVVDFFDQDQDEDFYDANHPYPETAKRWSSTLAPVISHQFEARNR